MENDHGTDGGKSNRITHRIGEIHDGTLTNVNELTITVDSLVRCKEDGTGTRRTRNDMRLVAERTRRAEKRREKEKA